MSTKLSNDLVTNYYGSDTLEAYNSLVSVFSTFVEGNQEIAEIIQEYNEGPSVVKLAEKIIKNGKTESSNELVRYLFESVGNSFELIQLVPVNNKHKFAYINQLEKTLNQLRKSNLTEIDQLRKVCVFYEENYDRIFEISLFHSKQFNRTFGNFFEFRCEILEIVNGYMEDERTKFLDLPIYIVTRRILNTINASNPTDELDPITLEPIEDNDLFVTKRGERFSLTSLAEYHKIRVYRGTKGEQYNQRFILNPRTNEFFPYHESCKFVILAICKKVELVFLHRSAVVGPGQDVPYQDVQSLHEYYIDGMKYIQQFPAEEIQSFIKTIAFS